MRLRIRWWSVATGSGSRWRLRGSGAARRCAANARRRDVQRRWQGPVGRGGGSDPLRSTAHAAFLEVIQIVRREPRRFEVPPARLQPESDPYWASDGAAGRHAEGGHFSGAGSRSYYSIGGNDPLSRIVVAAIRIKVVINQRDVWSFGA